MKTIGRKITGFIILIVSSLSITACSHSDTSQAGQNQFENEITAYTTTHPQPTADWTVYVAHGMVAKGWLWFKHRMPVVYALVENTSSSTSTDLVIHFGKKTFKSLAQGPNTFIGFDIQSSQIPQNIEITWKVNGKLHHETLKSVIEVD